ncbi:hypothetical protein LDENG_00227530 [Lucifuga dentata]|nr:hypothetical protein LDENG_00227530 [Lucifuga dentata]
MSAVTNQPLPFGPLEREKHIQMIFRDFHSQHRSSCESQDSPRPKSHQTSPNGQSVEQLPSLAPGKKKMENGHVGSPGIPSRTGDTVSPDCLALLDMVSQIHITARPELQGPQCIPRRIYSITTGGSRSQLFVAVEARACSLQGFDCHGRQVFYFERPLRMDTCCLGCCLMEMRAYTPQKHLIGTVYQRWSMFTPLLEVYDSKGASTIRIQGSCCPCRCFSNQQFQIVSNIGEKMGTIWKKWPGFNDEHNMDHEYFGMDVPLTMESNTKLLLLAATFLLNHMSFEMS